MNQIENLLQKISVWQKNGDRIVLTNGCFDLIHAGHIHLLKQAKSFGDRLVIALNSDRSIKKLKGNQRPILNESDRKKIMLSIRYVDDVILFDENTPEAIIALILPDVLVKGSDYKLGNIAGAQNVLGNGGRVEIVELQKGKSTTAIIEKIKNLKE